MQTKLDINYDLCIRLIRKKSEDTHFPYHNSEEEKTAQRKF